MHPILRNTSLAALMALASLPALADQCTTMQTTTTTMCVSAAYSAHANNKFTVVFGPGASFSGSGVGSTKGFTFQGSYTCQGNNFYTTTYTVNDGEQNYLIAQFPNTITGSGSQGIYFSGKLKAGACP